MDSIQNKKSQKMTCDYSCDVRGTELESPVLTQNEMPLCSIKNCEHKVLASDSGLSLCEKHFSVLEPDFKEKLNRTNCGISGCGKKGYYYKAEYKGWFCEECTFKIESGLNCEWKGCNNIFEVKIMDTFICRSCEETFVHQSIYYALSKKRDDVIKSKKEESKIKGWGFPTLFLIWIGTLASMMKLLNLNMGFLAISVYVIYSLPFIVLFYGSCRSSAEENDKQHENHPKL